MAKLKDIIKDYLYTQESNENIYLTKFGQSIIEDNIRILNITFFIVPILYVLIIAITYFNQGSVNNYYTILFFIPELLVYYAYRYLTNKNSSRDYYKSDSLCLSYYLIFLCQTMIIDNIAFSGSEALWFHKLLPFLALLYITRFTDYLMLNLVLSSIDFVMIFIFKHNSFFKIDMLNLISGLLFSLFTARIVCTIRNAQAQQNQTLREASSYDKLTGLLNKGAAQMEISSYFSSRLPGENAVVMSIDADNFKQINDKLGHKAGDIVLANIGKILKMQFRVDDIVARNGGDEFLVVMKGLVPPFHVDAICRRIQKSLASITVDGGWTFTCSIGVVIDTHGHEFDSIFAMADDALYECKIRGRDCFSEWYTYQLDFADDKPLIILCTAQSHEGLNETLAVLKQHYNILYAENGNEVLNISSQYRQQLALILLDMDVTKISATDVLTYIKQRPTFSHIPVVSLCSSPSKIATAKEHHADEIITIPFKPEKVLSDIQTIISKSQK